MNKKDAMTWVEALRSGKYEQCKEMLYDSNVNGYCCLGVLNKIMPHEYPSDLDEGELLLITEKFNSPTGRIYSLDIELSELNDGKRERNDNYIEPLSFNEIADIIQIFYEEL